MIGQFKYRNYGLLVCLGASFFLFISCQQKQKGSLSDRAVAVDHSTTKHFPPIGQQRLGDCTCWSSCYYYNTYTQAVDRDADASTGDPNVVCSPRFLFSLLSQGTAGAECTEHAMERLSEVGCANVSDYPMDAHFAEWPGEEARVAALKNRTGMLHKIRADQPEGLEVVKQHISDGGCAVTRGLFRSNYPIYGDSAAGPGIDNGVMYAEVGGEYLRHSLCICGYDDEKTYVDARDGKRYSGAFLIANSEGPDWGSYNSTGKGTRGFLWVAYNMFLEGTFGLYDNDTNPHKDRCYDNPDYPTIYFHDDRPDYLPALYAIVGVNHPQRNVIRLCGGLGSPDDPDYVGFDVIEQTAEGEIAIDDSLRVVLDLTDGLSCSKKRNLKEVFVELSLIESAEGSARITSLVVFYSKKNDGNYSARSMKEQLITIEPGETGHASVSIL